ncbi:uncharacterized protein K02A2.6-like [Achroia grisella]|uniref:uncharacterized protein K02A2.6-like n=1 Tax=Achroia grisella TaxID=688607 RepID=UPI0027D2D91A|nr:uncharacterized protein K02A2.6-like [Achroia grisella]
MPIGKIEPFDLNCKQWPAYVRRVNQFIILNEIKPELKVPMLITVVGEATYALMCDLCAPDAPETKTYEQLVALVTDHLEPQRSEIAERHVFRQRRQKPGESLTEYLQNLKHLAATCNFGDRLEENLRDQFVSGLASEMMRSRIFAEKNIGYGKAVELALALEAADRHAEVSSSGASATRSAFSSGEMEEGLHAGGGRPLLGRDWIKALNIMQININEMVDDHIVSQLCIEYPEVFTNTLGTCKKKIHLQLTDCEGVYVRARPVPLALRERVERELERLQRDGTIYRVDHSDFGTPIVPVVKSNGDLRLCGDYKITINPKLKRDFYPLPRIEELFANLSNGEEYTKIDLRHAYEQVLLDEESQRYTAITTHLGTFAYNRTPYGLSSVPEKFQKLMEETLRGVAGTVVFLDDICVTGFIIDKCGLRADPTKLDAITKMPPPVNVTQLKSFLGLINYYGKFIPNMSTLLYPLHSLLKKDTKWKWDKTCEQAFNSAKRVLLSNNVLAHYEEGRPLVLSVDSSAYGVGAVLAHRYDGGRSARHFVLRTDHKPLAYIFGEKRGIPQTAASRLQRWAARLAGYDFKIEFIKSTENGPADSLSRLPLQLSGRPTSAVHYFNYIEEAVPINFKDIATETKRDSLLSRIVGYINFGWPSAVSDKEEKPYFIRKNDLYIDLNCIIYKYRIVVPVKLRSYILKEIHEGHLGMNKMKNIARNYVYWPNIDNDIEQVARECTACQRVRDAPARAPLHPWEFPLNPWRRVHADFFDCAGKRYLIIVDAHSKWIETIPMSSTTASATINAFRSVFSRFGLPSQLVTDNGPPFFSEEFSLYCKNNIVKHTTSAPYRPQGNGEAENSVKTVKKVIKRALFEGEDVLTSLYRFLFMYRNTEHAITGVSPAVALLGRRLRGRLDALRPDTAAVVAAAQDKQMRAAAGQYRPCKVGETILTRDYSKKGDKWMEGQISAVTGPVSYKVKLCDGTEWRRHQDQILRGQRGRYSLSRASSEPINEEKMRSSDAEGYCRAEVTAGDREEQLEVEERSDGSSDYEDAVIESPELDASTNNSLPAGASARAIRAHKRAKVNI